MRRILVVGEDALSGALGERLVAASLPGWVMPSPAINTGGVTKLVRALPRYIQQSRHVQPVLCVADTDGRCAVNLRDEWLPRGAPKRFLLRLAVSEAESWILADPSALADYFEIPAARIPPRPEELADPKRKLLHLARRSGRRLIRQEVVSAQDANTPGPGYNLHLRDFIAGHWDARRAAEHSPSLARALARVAAIGGLAD